MQHVDRVNHVQVLAQPAGRQGAGVQDQTLLVVPCSQSSDGMSAYLRRARHLGQRAAIGTAEPKLASGIAFDLITLFVHGTMVAPTEHGQVRKRRRPSLSPVTDVMTLAEAHAAAREAAAAVAMMKRAAQGWGN